MFVFFILKLAGICQPIDKVIKKKIQCLMDEGVTKVAEMKRHIKSFSKKDLGNTSTQNRRFYPLDKDIRNVMDSYKNQTRLGHVYSESYIIHQIYIKNQFNLHVFNEMYT